MKRVLVKIAVTCGIIIVGYFVFFSAVTPSIKGVVIDAETKKPIENAWVIVTVINSTSTIAGSTGNTDALTRRHLRTGKDGRFNVSMHFFPAGFPPLCFGREVSDLKAIVKVADGRRAEIDLSKYLKKWSISINIPVKDEERKNKEASRELSTLVSYCTTGLYFPFYSYGSELCDKWELEYAINEHERFLKKLGKPTNMDGDVLYIGAVGRLAALYKQKGDYKRSLELFITARDFEKKYKVDLSGYENKINELREKLKNK